MKIREIFYQSLLRLSDIIGYNISIYKKSDTPCLTLEDLSRRYPDIIKIGEGTYSGRVYVGIYDSKALLKVGKYCSIAGDISFILGGNHNKGWATTYPFPAFWKEASHIKTTRIMINNGIKIGNDVWIGHGCTILSGTRIGSGAIVGAGSVLPADGYPPYSIIVGNPAKVVGYRFSQDVIDKLLGLRWWDWGEERIRENVGLLCSEDVQGLLGVKWIAL
jgi:acetyltransferase-like isoleucine patch superfamily enzyme